MNYELRCEGFPVDDDMRDALLLAGRRLVLQMGLMCPVRMLVKQSDGWVQSRVELLLPNRRISSIVRRREPVAAMEAAVRALSEAVGMDESLDAAG